MREGGGLVTGAIESLLRSGTLVGLSDQELLERFVREGDRLAFELIVACHGPLVLTVCQQILSDANDAEDAFQATFLVLLQRAGSVRRPGSLASWLHGVAYRIAVRIKRGSRASRLLDDPPGRHARCPVEEREELSILHQEIDRLPPKYRIPVVLCYLQGMTHDGAATQLRWPVGTVRGRLARARDRLREQLARREVTLAAGFMEIAWPGQAPLSEPQIQSVLDLLGNNASSRISHLVQGALTAMMIEKLKWLALTITTACLVVLAAGSGLVARARTGPENVAVGPMFQVKTEGRKDTDPRKGVPRREPESTDLPKAADASRGLDPEARANMLEENRVKAELLELETAALKQEIQRSMRTVNQFKQWVGHGGGKTRVQEGGPGGGDGRGLSHEESLKLATADLEEQQTAYLAKRLELARLKREIARQSRALNQPVGEKADLTEMNQRLGSLETKVEKILEQLSTKQ
jgi:RNA polymerase sigma factor (sigma-70 family)